MKLLNLSPRSFTNLLRESAGMSLKTLTPLLVAAALVSGCATDAPPPALQARHDAARSVAKVEIIYNQEDELIVVDGGGSGLTSFAGFLGPIGALLALGIDTNSRMTTADRTDRRSKEFTAAVRNSGVPMGLNSYFAERLAARLRDGGREVKLTPFMRATGKLPEMQVPELQPTPGYSTLILRITTAYGASDATSSFKPIVAVEQLLRDEHQAVLYQASHTSDLSQPTYFRYDGLLNDPAVAREGLRQGLAQVVQPAYAGMFGDDEPRMAHVAAGRTVGPDPK
ncbi:hypothetical protein PMI12_04426 [Variovorax sp. CF313]|jgi:hypothetical protein|uniref:hypothetical protein n=1 Tax=Variovorax sp. CF313 TaxID=1144315 RepID=UPI0002713EBC|nr:hypothetical protein [Variovorax sp. CF313]EJL71178.1 hypothetical protein PMI12_04426 [Variovorax sp. CF313]